MCKNWDIRGCLQSCRVQKFSCFQPSITQDVSLICMRSTYRMQSVLKQNAHDHLHGLVFTDPVLYADKFSLQKNITHNFIFNCKMP